jgi:adenylosuccinate lyase
VIARYARPAMARIWSDESRARALARRRARRARRWAEVGAIRRGRRSDPRDAVAPSAERVAEIERVTDHDVAAFVDAVAEQLGPDGRWVHYGLTSSDVVDTALVAADPGRRARSSDGHRARARRPSRAGGGAPAHDLHRPLARHPRRADDVRVEARGLGVRARPRAHAARAALERTASGSSPGTVGTYAQLEPEVERIACERLGLEPDPLSTQVIARDRHASC